MAFKEISESFHDISDRIQDYGTSMVEYQKLRLFKSSMKGATSLVNLLVIGSIFLFVLLFISLGAAFIIGNSLGKVSYGFFVVGGFYAVILLVIVIFGRRKIEKTILLHSSKLFYDDGEMGAEALATNELENFKRTVKEEEDR